MTDQIASMVIAAAQARHFSREQVIPCLATGIQESGLDENAIGGGGAWHGVFQQDTSYPYRDSAQGNIDGFFDRLVVKMGSPGASPDIWKNIFWLQQSPASPSADIAFVHGRQAYLTEIQSRTAQATALYDRLIAPQPVLHPDVAISEFKKYLGDDYVYGGTGPGGSNPGFDCSGLVDFVLYVLVNGTPSGFVRNLSTLSWVPGHVGPFGTVQVSGPHAFPANAAITIAIHHEHGGESDHMNCAIGGYIMESSGDYGVCTNTTGAIPQDDSYWTDWWCLPGGLEDDMFTDEDRRFLGDLHGALFNPISSLSPFRHIGEGAVLQQHQLPINDDGFEHPQYVEWAAQRGDMRQLTLLTEVANADPVKHPDRAQDIALAKVVLLSLGQPVPGVTPVTPQPVPAPTPDPGSNSVGPSGLIGIIGIIAQAVGWTLQQTWFHVPPQWAAIASGVLGLLTVLGIYKAPNQKVSDAEESGDIPPDVPPVTPPVYVPQADTLGSTLAEVAEAEAKAADAAARAGDVIKHIEEELG
jgi:hypothetical protein